MITYNDKTIDDIRQTYSKVYDGMYIFEIFMSNTRKSIKAIEERTATQYYGITIEEMFAMDFRNTIDKLRNRSVGMLNGMQIGLIQKSISNTGFKGKLGVIKPIKEYNLKIKLIKKYDNKVKY